MIKTNKTGRLLLCMAVFATWLFSACDDTMGGTNTLGFPMDTLSFVANPNDTIRIPVKVSSTWTLSSNKDWCRTEEGEMDASGLSGSHVVPFIITDKAHGFLSEDRAEIMLTMNGESRVRAYITRLAKNYFMEVSGDSGVYAAGTSVKLGTSGSVQLNVKTNFNLNLLRISYPEWLKATHDGGTIRLSVVGSSVKYMIDEPEDSLILFNNDTTFRRSFHVQYAGMDAMELRVDQPIEETLIVSQNTKRCHTESKKYVAPMNFTISALNDGYRLVSVAYDDEKGCSVLPPKERWFEVEDNRLGNVSLSFEEMNTGDERMAYLLALPQALTDSLERCEEGYDVALANFLLDTAKTDLKEDVLKYRLVKMAQDGVMNITISPETRWNLRVATDGKTYSDAIKGDTLDAATDPVEAMITTYRGYKLMCAAYDNKVGCTIMEVEDSWLNVVDDTKGKVKVRFKANEENERILYLFALPLPLVEELEMESAAFHDNLSRRLFEEVDGLREIKAETEQFVIAKFTQEANEENAIKVLKKGIEVVDVVKETDQEWLAMAEEKGVSAGKVFRCSMKLGYMYQIKPLIPLSIWNTAFSENKDRLDIYGKSGKKFESGIDYKEEHFMMEELEGDYMLVQLTEMRVHIKEDFIIYFINNDTEHLKALVVILE
ncbi:MAG: DUF5003 domain-containing protein [Bacteroidaceae bacterium]|nr:DUF5003 domain-containing protein [Bacteroidaceae bacterium]